ncbi:MULTISPECIES: hypothetical protein [unclassified Saccharothrix]|uniref:hypothetical protein n=1 Tax=unclassified Saccharothrix TaxID=2593673 RepID=UPI00307D2CD4
MTRTNCFTRRALDECIAYSAGSSWLYESRSPVEQNVAVVKSDCSTFWVHRLDDLDSQLIVIVNQDSEHVLPRNLHGVGRQVIERMSAFVNRADSTPISLPATWAQYKADSVISFFAWKNFTRKTWDSLRWIVEPQRSAAKNICFWKLSSVADQTPLSAFVPDRGLYESTVGEYPAALLKASEELAKRPEKKPAGSAIVIPDRDFREVAADLTYSGWLTELTQPQRRFVEQPPKHSIRLRGPAGSGKTLALELKALREAKRAEERGDRIRILFVTHSWVTAERVDRELNALSEWGAVDKLGIEVYPLLVITQEILPPERWDANAQLIGEDSFSGKKFQLQRISAVLDDLKDRDWVTFADKTSPAFRARVESSETAERQALVWDLLIEFGCVLGAEGIFPGFNAEQRYKLLSRAAWMMPLDSLGDREVVYYIYKRYLEELLTDGCLTSDQLINDFLNYLVTFAWNRRRLTDGYNLIFVDELHLFDAQERLLLHYLTQSSYDSPKIFMALDPRQSPWEVYTELSGFSDIADSALAPSIEFDEVKLVDLPTVHRYTPEVLDLVKHLHLEYPMLDLGIEWEFDFESVESSAAHGPKPEIIRCGTSGAELTKVFALVQKITDQRRSTAAEAGRVAIAVLDETQFPEYRDFAQRVTANSRTQIAIIESREDVETIERYVRRPVVVGPVEYLAGLQFDTLIVCGMPDTNFANPNTGHRQRRFLSLLYLGVSRAARDVKILVNADHGGLPRVLEAAVDKGLVKLTQGPEV